MTDDYEEKIEKARQLLPAWFIPRMMGDSWHFAIVLTSGDALYVEHIDDVCLSPTGTIWLDVTLYTQKEADRHDWQIWKTKLLGAPTSRLSASINAAEILYVVELADT
jgi:hypothetical protein